MDLETVVKLEAKVSGTWEEQDVCSVRSFLEHNPGLSPTDKEKVLTGEDEVYLNLGAGGIVRLMAEPQTTTGGAFVAIPQGEIHHDADRTLVSPLCSGAGSRHLV